MSINIINNNQLKNIAGIDESNLSAVAISGNYSDLTDAPDSLPANGGNAATVGGKTAAELQNYNNLSNRPDIPSTFTDVGAAKGNADGVAINGATKIVNTSGNVKTAGSAYQPVWLSQGDLATVYVSSTMQSGSPELATCGGVYSFVKNNSGASVETGTWTPSLTLSGGNMSIGEALYWKIGKLVIISASFFDSSSGQAGNGSITKISGLPFTSCKSSTNAPIKSKSGLIRIYSCKNQSNIMKDSNIYSIEVSQNTTILDLNGNSIGLATSSESYMMFGYYITN